MYVPAADSSCRRPLCEVGCGGRRCADLNWDNVFCAGGSVLACLLPPPEAYNATNITRRDYFHNVAYAGSDVDLFLYGLSEVPNAHRDAPSFPFIGSPRTVSSFPFIGSPRTVLAPGFPPSPSLDHHALCLLLASLWPCLPRRKPSPSWTRSTRPLRTRAPTRCWPFGPRSRSRWCPSTRSVTSRSCRACTTPRLRS